MFAPGAASPTVGRPTRSAGSSAASTAIAGSPGPSTTERRRCIADAYEGQRFNSPNDVVVAGDGAVWFTDPSYGIRSDYEGHQADEEIGGRNVYRVGPGR